MALSTKVALQKPLKEAMTLCSENSLDGSHINRNIVNEIKGLAPVAENETLHVKQLIVKDFN